MLYTPPDSAKHETLPVANSPVSREERAVAAQLKGHRAPAERMTFVIFDFRVKISAHQKGPPQRTGRRLDQRNACMGKALVILQDRMFSVIWL